MNAPEFTELNPAEEWREYYFLDGSKTLVYNVVRVAVSKSGAHMLETSDGLKHIVLPRWNRISFKGAWTF